MARQHKWSSPVLARKHKKNIEDLAKSAATRELQRLNEARAALSLDRHAVAASAAKLRTQHFIVSSLRARLSTVLASYGLETPIDISEGYSDSAVTDFERIKVVVAAHRLRHEVLPNGELSFSGKHELKTIVSDIRGRVYHEMGHILYTVPLPELVELADISDDDRSKYRINARSESFHTAWNILEDQRIERALVQDSPDMAMYLVWSVLTMVIPGGRADPRSWSALAGREYFPTDFLQASADAWDAWDALNIQYTSADVQNIVRQYSTSNDAAEMLRLIDQFCVIIGLGDPAPVYVPATSQRFKSSGNNEESQKKLDAVKTITASAPAEEADEEEADEEEAEVEAEKEKGTAQGSSKPLPALDALRKLANRAAQLQEDSQTEILSSDRVQEDLNTIMDMVARKAGTNASRPIVVNAFLHNHELESKARGMVSGIVDALEQATAENAPRWEGQQRQGVVEALRYRTRQPGEVEYRRDFVDKGEIGKDIAVSLFCDISGSMDTHEAELSAAAWAVKRACSEISVACSVNLFNNDAMLLWGDDDEAGAEIPLLDAFGGTDPTDSFICALHERDVKHHLVLVMTDGEWVDRRAIVPFLQPNMTTAAVYFTGYEGDPMITDAALATGLHVDMGFYTGDLWDIPRIIHDMIDQASFQ